MITCNLIAGKESGKGSSTLQSVNPSTKQELPEKFVVATSEEVNAAVAEAKSAAAIFKKTSGNDKAMFLRAIADEIENLGDTLVERAMAESGLPEGRIVGERGRTCSQLRLFASLVEEGSWVDAIIDEAIPDRQPLPRVDIRKMTMAIGPVVVFTASNFPLAFSTAGGDTASALAAGCPVIVKAHPSHLGTNALISEAISRAVGSSGLPSGVFSSVVGGYEVGQELVKHEDVNAVAFTGSFRGGKALMDIASQRPEPIPVYAEMGSVNPIFILPQKLESESESLAKTIAGSVNLGAGQFCTNPGILVAQKSHSIAGFITGLEKEFTALQPAVMLNEGIYTSYNKNKSACTEADPVSVIYDNNSENGGWKGGPAVAQVSGKEFLENRKLHQEVFGPFTLLVICENEDEMKHVADAMEGQLTATIMATDGEIEGSAELIDSLSDMAGRVIWNGVPTGVEVCPAMHHGGPFPATSNSLYTSVGTDAIKRFARPVAFQNMPDALLPDALKASNPLGIWRTVNGEKVQS